MTQPSSTPLPSSKLYDKLKISAQLLLPAVATLYFTVAQIWGLPAAEEVTGTITAVNVFVGVAVVWMKSLYSAAGPQYDGTLTWEDNAEGSLLRMRDIDVRALDANGQVLLKVVRPEPKDPE